MTKALVLLALAALAVRWLTGRWPWEFLQARQSQADKLAAARRLLSVPRNATPAQIREAHRRKAAIAHPDRGGSTPAQQELNAARDLLLADLPPPATEPDQ
ncbi:J domain-containing protein [Erythrobacter litoralis]|uniref:J domain-containing protein n=1 Tax=Erythrobacter litoralis TaxID=39960 RepID=UPI002434E48D|nr:J domain-containing protein [Erythrobacter litoralis]MDG6080040.1 J domain-containing protein [Erythrobacter litoralis]